ncbi:hypothetical protein C8J57DRAFT_1280309 [Mycena rebaudengoi]|nr:hypothetical protein C8J57DRAFT_1280309 [Mycena rebaudengoi]
MDPELISTKEWDERRLKELPHTNDVVLWGTTDIVNTRTRERKQGHQEALTRDPEFKAFDDMQKKMEDLLADKKRLFPQYFDQPRMQLPQSKPTTSTGSPRTNANAEAGPSRLRAHATVEVGRSSSTIPAKRKTNEAEITGFTLPTKRQTLPTSPPANPSHQSTSLPRLRTRNANGSDVRSVSRASSTTLVSHSGSRDSTSFSTLVSSPSTNNSRNDHPCLHSNPQSPSHTFDSIALSGPSANISSTLPHSASKRKAIDGKHRRCVRGCGSLLLHSDKDICSKCSSIDGSSKTAPAPTSVARLPLPKSLLKGKNREQKSLRLDIETEWSEIAFSADGAAGIKFVNEMDDEEVPPTLRGEGWEFQYLEDKYLPCETIPYNPASATPLCESSFFTYCTCAACRDAANCKCQDLEMREARSLEASGHAYSNGLFNFTYKTSDVVVECNPYCHCSSECPNRVAQCPRKILIEVFKTENRGWGARAPVDVERGTVLGMYTGKLIRRDEAEKLTGDAKTFCFDLDYSEESSEERPENTYSVDSLKHGNWTRFINHSCDPNLHVQPIIYDTLQEQNMAFLGMIALTFIPAGTEFTFDYDPSQRAHEADLAAAAGRKHGRSTTSSGKSKGKAPPPPNSTYCFCGAKKCRGWVRA